MQTSPADAIRSFMESKLFKRFLVPTTATIGALLALNWLISPSEAELIAEGRELFSHEWTVNDPLCGEGDGLGPVFNEKSCVACHFQGGVGGAGSASHNVDSFDVLPTEDFAGVRSSVVHKQATDESLKETKQQVRQAFPPIPDGIIIRSSCGDSHTSLDPVKHNSINTPALFGVGLIDDISSMAIKSNLRGRAFDGAIKEFNLDFDTSNAVGQVRKHGLGQVGRFGWKGQFSSLREFVASACAVELGLTNRRHAQPKPGEFRPDDEAEYDMTNRQLDALVAFCRQLPRPQQVMPRDPVQQFQVRNGEQYFISVGCADCHTPNLGGVEGIYSDFGLYSLEYEQAKQGYGTREFVYPIPNDHSKSTAWQTPPLWGVADSAPYFHDGSSQTLEDAIERHSGQAAKITERYRKLGNSNRRDIISFLKSLRAPNTAEHSELTDQLQQASSSDLTERPDPTAAN